MSDSSKAEIRALFARHGLRCTKQRIALYQALAATTSHPTADELYRSIHPSVGNMSLATVYNTLDALCDAGLALKLSGSSSDGNASARYDATVDDHLHVRCQRTHRMADVPDDLSRKLLDGLPRDVLDQIETRLGFRIGQVQIELVGEFGGRDAN